MPYASKSGGKKKRSGAGRRRGGMRKRKVSRMGGKGRKGKSRASRAVSSEISTMRRVTAPRRFEYVLAQRPAGVIGFSLFMDLCCYNDSVDISLMHNKLQAVLGTGTTTTQPLNKFAVGDFTGIYQLKNNSNADLEMDIYKCTARDDLDVTLAPIVNFNAFPTGGATSAITYAAGPFQQALEGYQEATSPIGSTFVNRNTWPLSITPYQINKFCTYFKILGKPTKLRMLGGAYKQFKIRDKRWNLWNGTKVNGCTGAVGAADTAFRNRTIWYFAIIRGTIVNDSVTAANVNFSRPDISLGIIERYQYTGVTNAVASIDVPIQVLGTITTAQTITAQTELVVPVTSS